MLGAFSAPALEKKQENFLIFLRILSKKGFYEILKYVEQKKSLQYNQVQKYAIENKIVDSNASITIILNGLTNIGLLERTVKNERPVRTTYSLTKTGSDVLKKLRELERHF